MTDNLCTRPSAAWAVALAAKKDALAKTHPWSAEIEQKINRHLLISQTYHNLLLDEVDISLDRVSDLLLQPPEPDCNLTEADWAAMDFSRAARFLVDIASKYSPQSPVNLNLHSLQELHRLALEHTAEDAGQLRSSNLASIIGGHQPAPAQALPGLLEFAFDWFSVDSVRELHPIEQAVLAHIRLYDLHPFTVGSGRIARLAASFFTIREGLPPIIIRSKNDYQVTLAFALKMATQPIIELFAKSVGETFDELIKLATLEGQAAKDACAP